MSYMNKLAFSLTVILRIYSQDDFFEKIYIPSAGFGIIHPLKEVQVGLVFARDYDEHGKHTNGLFKPYWDERKVTPQLISDFKQNYTSRGVKAKVFATIGGRSTQYPFQIKGGEGIDAWVSNAAESLTSIVKKYNLDGIDVYYEHINAKQDDFVGAIGQLIEKLKKENVITEASIAPSADVNQNFYVPLYKKHGKSIGTVVYQCHNEVEPVPDPQTLFDRFQTEAVQNYGRENLLAGYSAIYTDWNTVLPIVYFLGGAKILGVGSFPDLVNPFAYSAVGTSIWVVFPNESLVASPSVTSVTPNFPKWMLDASTRKIMAY